MVNGEEQLMKIKWLIVFAFIMGYSGGLFVDVAAHGNESKILHAVETGEVDERWIPFRSTSTLNAYGMELLKITSFERPPSSPLIQYAELSESSQEIISSVFVDFTLASVKNDPDEIPSSGDEYFTTAIGECNFSSKEDIPHDTCVICTLTGGPDPEGEPIKLAQGKTELPLGYESPAIIPVEITDILVEGGNDPKNLVGVTIHICHSEEMSENLSASPAESFIDQLSETVGNQNPEDEK